MDAPPRPPSSKRLVLGVAAVLLLNLLLLLLVQHYWHGDFPFQDEWGYLARLRQEPQSGFGHYLFDPYYVYYGPVLFFFWYLAYAWTHLDIVAIRYTGACMSVLVAALLAAMLYRRASLRGRPLLLLLVYAVFAVCSLNHFMTYYQSIQALVQPFSFGVVLCAMWAGEKTLEGRRVLLWCALCIALALIATGVYAPGLAVLPALAAAQILLLRRLTPASVLLGIVGLLLIVFYVSSAHGLAHANQRPSASAADLLQAGKMWVGLTGNALFSPHTPRLTLLTYGAGLLLLAAQLCGFGYALRQPPEQHRRLFIPVALTLYNNLVILEIIGTRLHTTESDLASSFTARYTILALAGPVSVLFYAAMLGDLVTSLRRWAVAAFLAMALGTLAADTMILVVLPHYAQVLARVRTQLLSLQGDPNPFQQTQMMLTPAMEPLVYPGKLYLQQEHLALYRGDVAPPSADP
ncbi:MAG TPA: hypothetical protein VGH71_08345 [Gammaproteobacteria bacterium]|jgi:hypothetical protein